MEGIREQFWAQIEAEAERGAQEVTALLTRAEIREYVKSCLTMNAYLRISLSEQTSMMKPIAVGSKDEFDRRRAAVGSPL